MPRSKTKPLPKGVFSLAPETAAAVPMPVRTLLLRVKQGLVPSYKFGKHRLFKIPEVIAAIEKCRVGTVDEVLK